MGSNVTAMCFIFMIFMLMASPPIYACGYCPPRYPPYHRPSPPTVPRPRPPSVPRPSPPTGKHPPPHHGGGGGPKVSPPSHKPPAPPIVLPPIIITPPVITPPVTNPPVINPPVINPPVIVPSPPTYPPYTGNVAHKIFIFVGRLGFSKMKCLGLTCIKYHYLKLFKDLVGIESSKIQQNLC